MPKLIMTKGLPASGKSTWAKEQVLKSKGRTKRINKDDLRAMVDAGEWSKANEKIILHTRDGLICQYLSSGLDVIVDDTNLAPNHERDLRMIAYAFTQCEFVIKDFTDVPLVECLKRDAERANSVGEKVIKGMYNSFLKPKKDVVKYSDGEQKCQEKNKIVTSTSSGISTLSGSPKDETLPNVRSAESQQMASPQSTTQNTREQRSTTLSLPANRANRSKKIVASYEAPPYNPDLPSCIIVDIDGTVAHMDGRYPYDYSMVHTDIPDDNVVEIVRRYSKRDPNEFAPDTYIIILSGRTDDCKDVTEQWLQDNRIPYDEIHMRKAGDIRNDAIVKKEIYEEWVKPRFNVRFVLDDRDRVVKMWRDEGLKVLQVAYGDF